MAFNVLESVELLEDFPAKGATRGMKGTIVEKFESAGEAYDVEIVSDDGLSEILLPSVLPSQLRLITT